MDGKIVTPIDKTIYKTSLLYRQDNSLASQAYGQDNSQAYRQEYNLANRQDYNLANRQDYSCAFEIKFLSFKCNKF